MLDVYRHVDRAFMFAQIIMDSTADLNWTRSRPGRWYGGNGELIEVQQHEVK
jgi:hypothetical protein